MSELIQRRRLLLSMAALPALGLGLAACTDSNAEAEAGAPATDPITTAAVEAPPSSGTVDMDKLLEEGALEDKVLGDENAPVTIVEYASMTCSHCATFHTRTYPELKKKYIETGKVRFILREFPFDPRAEAGFMLARCSDDKYFAMVDVLFKQQNNWAPVQDAQSALLKISKLAGFTQESFEACLTDQELLTKVRAVRARGASDFGVDATPTFFINGKKYSGAMSIDEISAVIDGML
ncbi:DSBA oxidoreductase [Nitratireductor aquibiodomus RA22]|uniref:Protein-disulfide isomerase n=2 Tax=Nitratireductor aquibiodomus TaxID=204799 RepID=A0A1H4N377_9HYPH|nr:DsbA family protein [Nitratireductor aquibiodomus]EIM75654.1 DSBA oxidoreductase [Nitratireductor aquibiodomus RA22]SEB89547.1 Protein-disulfide isomerase [Nitratireductor aquibiodomus]